MAWSWSHTAEAYATARENLEELPRDALEEICDEWALHDADEGHPADEEVDIPNLPDDVLVDYIWERAEEQALCDNGGWTAWVCPYGCHTVPFSRENPDEEPTENPSGSRSRIDAQGALQDLHDWAMRAPRGGNPYMVEEVRNALRALSGTSTDLPARRPRAKVEGALYDLTHWALHGERYGLPENKPEVKAAAAVLGGTASRNPSQEDLALVDQAVLRHVGVGATVATLTHDLTNAEGMVVSKTQVAAAARRLVKAGKLWMDDSYAPPRYRSAERGTASRNPEPGADVSGLHFKRISTWEPGFVAAIRRHYTGSRGAPVGKKMAWEIHEDGVLRGWIGIGEPSFKLAPRRLLGLEDARPLPQTVNNFIFRLETPGATKASGVLRAWHEVATRDWESRYGWRIQHWETLVDPSKVSGAVFGACYRRAGYRHIGSTTGRSCHRPAGHSHGARVWGAGTVKEFFYRGPLVRGKA